jgi:hypothetical protein
MEAFTPGQAARVEDMVRNYEEALARQRESISRLTKQYAHLRHHCPKGSACDYEGANK